MSDETDVFSTRWRNDTIKLFCYHLSISYHEDGRIAEVRYNGPHNGSALASITQDACSLISELLRRYVSPHLLSEVIERDDDGEALSIIGKIILTLVERQQ